MYLWNSRNGGVFSAVCSSFIGDVGRTMMGFVKSRACNLSQLFNPLNSWHVMSPLSRAYLNYLSMYKYMYIQSRIIMDYIRIMNQFKSPTCIIIILQLDLSAKFVLGQATQSGSSNYREKLQSKNSLNDSTIIILEAVGLRLVGSYW